MAGRNEQEKKRTETTKCTILYIQLTIDWREAHGV